MKIALIGANGQLGSDLNHVLSARGRTVQAFHHAAIEITNAAQVEEVIGRTGPDVVISTAAFHKVEECERDPMRAFGVNATGAMNLAKTCARVGAILVYFSTDYVFDGTKREPYVETDAPAPVNVYGASKVAGEHLIVANMERYFVIRTCGLYGVAGSSGKGGNFVETMLKKAHEGSTIRVVNDQVLAPTSTWDLSTAVDDLITSRVYGLYQISDEGQCSWYEFARKIFDLEGLSADLQPVATREFPSPVKRPAYSVMSKEKLHGLGIAMPCWEDSLAGYLEARVAKRAASLTGD